MKYSKCDSNNIVSKTANQFNITCQMQTLQHYMSNAKSVQYYMLLWILAAILDALMYILKIFMIGNSRSQVLKINDLHSNISKEKNHMW